ATVEQASVAIGGTQKINASFASATATSGLFLGIEVFGPGGTVIAYQKWFQNESFAAGEQRTYSVSWQIPRGVATGGYTVATSAYSSGWRNSLGSEPTAATFNVTPADGSTSGPPVPPATDSRAPVADANPVPGADPSAIADAHLCAKRLGRRGERRPWGIPQPDRLRHERDGDDCARRYRDLSAWRGDLDLSGVVREPDVR